MIGQTKNRVKRPSADIAPAFGTQRLVSKEIRDGFQQQDNFGTGAYYFCRVIWPAFTNEPQLILIVRGKVALLRVTTR